MRFRRISIEKQFHFHLVLGANGTYNLEKNSWLIEFRQNLKRLTGQDVWKPKIAGKIGQFYRLIQTESLPSANRFGWIKLAQTDGAVRELSYWRPDVLKQYDTLLSSVALAKDFADGQSFSLLPEEIRDIHCKLQSNDDANSFFPSRADDELIGESWFVEILYDSEKELDLCTAIGIAYDALASVFPSSSRKNLVDAAVLGSTPTKLPFGWLFKCLLRKASKSVLADKPCFILLVDSTNASEMAAASQLGENYINELMLTEVKALKLEGIYWRYRPKLEQASRDMDAILSDSSNPRSEKKWRALALDVYRGSLSWGNAASMFLRAAATIDQNSVNSERVAQDVAECWGIPNDQSKILIDLLSSDVRTVRDQFSADKDWILIEQENTAVLASVVKEHYLIEAEREDQSKKDSAGIWLALIGLILAIFGIPDWFPNSDEWSSIPLYWREIIVFAVFLSSGLLFLKSYRRIWG
jgi:hypothetical protein